MRLWREPIKQGREVYPLPRERGWGRRLAEASDINPLTITCTHCTIIHPRLGQSLTLNPKEDPKTQGEATSPAHPRTQRPQPIPKGGPSRRPAAQAKAERPPTEDRHLLIPTGSRAPFPDPLGDGRRPGSIRSSKSPLGARSASRRSLLTEKAPHWSRIAVG